MAFRSKLASVILVLLSVLLDVYGTAEPAWGQDIKAGAKPEATGIRFLDGKLNAKPGTGKPDPEAMLARKVDISVKDTTLGKFAQRISDEAAITVVLDREALESIGIMDDSPVAIQVNNITLHSALRRLLLGIDPTLRLECDGEVLIITTAEAAAERLTTKVYRVADLAEPPHKEMRILHGHSEPMEIKESSLRPLMELISRTIDPASWDAEGGPAQIQSIGSHSLAVCQTWEQQRRVAALLEALRELRDGQKTPGDAPPPPRSIASRAEREAAERIQAILARPISLDFKETRLSEVLHFISDLTGLPIRCDTNALESINVTDENLVSIRVRNVSLRSALHLLLRNIDPTLTWNCQDEGLMITTKEAASENLPAMLYPVRDLMTADPTRGIEALNAEELADAITFSVEPASWDAEGGPASIQYVASCHALLVVQAEKEHRTILELLNNLRDSRKKAAAQKPEKPLATAPHAEESIVVVYHLQQPSMTESLRSLISGARGTPERNVEELKGAIRTFVGADHWPAGRTSMHFVNHDLIIQQPVSVQKEIHRFLRELKILASSPARKWGGSGGFGQLPVVGFGGVAPPAPSVPVAVPPVQPMADSPFPEAPFPGSPFGKQETPIGK